MQLGVDSFVATAHHGPTGDAARVQQLLEQIELADQVGLDVFGIGEHHRPEYVSSAPAVLLAGAAARTKRIRLASAVTVLSSEDPVRVFQQFATVDLISHGRAEIIVGRGSFIESYPLFGFDLANYDRLFAEKLGLLLQLREHTHVHWSGEFRPALSGQGVYPRPVQQPLPVWIGVGGTMQSVVRAGTLGLPLVIAIIGGSPARFREFVEAYREEGRRAQHPPERLKVAIHSMGFIADSTRIALDTFWPGYQEMFAKLGRERGWPPPTRTNFEAQCSPAGALMVGEPEAVAEKIIAENEIFGGLERLTILLDNRRLAHREIMHAIELLGTRVAPLVHQAIGAAAPTPSNPRDTDHA